MPFIGNKPSAVPLTSADIADSIITSAKIVDATIANADIANSTIDLTAKVTGTLPTTKGGTGLATIGTANQVLAVNSGATALEYQAVSSDYVLLATTNITSSTASVSFDGYFSSTYKNYKIIASQIISVTNTRSLVCRFRRSNADITTANYKFGLIGFDIDSTVTPVTFLDGGWNETYFNIETSTNASNTTSIGGISFEGIIYNPLNASSYKSFQWSINKFSTYNHYYGLSGAVTLQDSVSALSGLSFFFSNSSNIASGNFKLYGIK